MLLLPIAASVEKIDFQCPECKRWFTLSVSQWKNRSIYNTGRVPCCSHACGGKRAGKEHRIKALERKLAKMGGV